MKSPRTGWKRTALFAGFALPAILLSLSCITGSLLVSAEDQMDTQSANEHETAEAVTSTHKAQDEYQTTQTAFYATEWARYETDVAIIATGQCATSTARYYLTQTQAAPKPPVITRIDFPPEIPGNDSTIIGLLYFQDMDGDISHIDYTVIRATEFSGGRDPNPQLNSGSWADGSLKIFVHCRGQQTVTLQARLFDRAGNGSNEMRFSFTCK